MTHEPVGDVRRRDAGGAETASANRGWWDAEAPDYYAEHGAFLGDTSFVWGPEGLAEADAGLLGDVAGARVLEIGAGAGQCSRWLAARGALPVAVDLSIGMLRQGVAIDPDDGRTDGPGGRDGAAAGRRQRGRRLLGLRRRAVRRRLGRG